MITIITGVPGMGKTAQLVSMLLDNDRSKQPRPVFVMGIPDLKIEHIPAPPVDDWTRPQMSPEDPNLILHYYQFPPNSLLVVDEAQRVFRARSSGSKPPPWVQALETHRHGGLDIILLTQKPHLLDSNVRELCGQHIHIKNTLLGRRLFEWVEYNDVNNKTNLDAAVKRRFSPPKEAFAYYKSAEVHTKQPRRFHQVWLYLAISLSATIYFAYTLYNSISSKYDKSSEQPSQIVQKQPEINLNPIPNGFIPTQQKESLQPQPVPQPVHPYMGYNFYIQATINNKRFDEIYFLLTNGSNEVFIKSSDLKKLGYSILQANECSAFLIFENAKVLASCRSGGTNTTTPLGGEVVVSS